MTGDALELYIHIPFCVRKCAYCDFLSFPAEETVRRAYTEALEKEITALAERYGGRKTVSIFFGGGTPTVLPASDLVRILTLIKEYYQVEEDAEVSLECNPGTVKTEDFRLLKEAGFNRLSIGCQSTREEELLLLGRIHGHADFLKAFEGARQAGFGNISVDLMFALPGQSREAFRETLRKTAALCPEHISAYSLILEEGTPFYERRNEMVFPSEEEEAGMYEDCAAVLGEYGFHRYEISNYAKEGFECRHNTGYWTGVPYLGLGLGSSSFSEGLRYENTKDLREYINLAGEPDRLRRSIRTVGRAEAMGEFMILGLRLVRGVSEAEFEERFGESPDSVFGPALDKYVKTGFMKRENGRISLTDRGFPVSNYIMADFV